MLPTVWFPSIPEEITERQCQACKFENNKLCETKPISIQAQTRWFIGDENTLNGSILNRASTQDVEELSAGLVRVKSGV